MCDIHPPPSLQNPSDYVPVYTEDCDILPQSFTHADTYSKLRPFWLRGSPLLCSCNAKTKVLMLSAVS